MTSVLSSVIGSTEATGIRWKTACGALEPFGIRTGRTLSSLLLSRFHSRNSSGSSDFPNAVEIAASRSR